MAVRKRSLAGALLALPACAGARYAVHADEARYPVSFSPVLLDEQGRPAYLGEDLEPCCELKAHATKMSLLYGFTSGALDLSSQINRAVEEHAGVGLVSLAVAVDNCATNFFFPFTLLPFWPGCQSPDVTGIVVRKKRLSGPVPAASGVAP